MRRRCSCRSTTSTAWACAARSDDLKSSDCSSLLGDGKIDSHQNWKGRFKDNSDRMRTGSIYDVVEVLKSLTFLSKSKSLSFREKRMLDRAKFLVVSEMHGSPRREDAGRRGQGREGARTLFPDQGQERTARQGHAGRAAPRPCRLQSPRPAPAPAPAVAAARTKAAPAPRRRRLPSASPRRPRLRLGSLRAEPPARPSLNRSRGRARSHGPAHFFRDPRRPPYLSPLSSPSRSTS